MEAEIKKVFHLISCFRTRFTGTQPQKRFMTFMLGPSCLTLQRPEGHSCPFWPKFQLYFENVLYKKKIPMSVATMSYHMLSPENDENKNSDSKRLKN